MTNWRAGVAMIALALAPAGLAWGGAGERVTFESPGPEPATGQPTRVHGLLFRPAAAKADERRPAIVALHGCGGMYSAAKGKRDELSVRHQAVADLLTGEGYVVLFPDSFRSRGVEEICTVESRERKITGAHRRQDAQAALAWLQRRDDVLPDRVAALGWSHGGSTVLGVLDSRDRTVSAWKETTPAAPYFRAGVSFYPGCSAYLKARRGYSLAAPLTLFIGEADDWTPPGPCIDLAAQLAAAREPVAITVYPGAYHSFDGPSTPKRVRLDVPNGVNPGKGVTVGSDAAARDDSYAKMKAFLRERLAP